MNITIDHGQKIYIIEPNELDTAIELILAEDKLKFKMKHWDWHEERYYKTRDYAKEHADEGIFLGYCYWNGNEEKELSTLLNIYDRGHGYQRFQFENAQCHSCCCYWRIANPTYLGIYPNYDFDISELKYPLLNCPECGGKLSRDAIWIGEKLDLK